MPKIVGQIEAGAIEVDHSGEHHLYRTPKGVVIRDLCRNCRLKIEVELGQLDEIIVNKPSTIYMQCPKCEEEWNIPILFEMKVTGLFKPDPDGFFDDPYKANEHDD